MHIQIDAVKINPGRRKAMPEQVKALAKSLSEVGLLNPITIDRDHTLIAGLHRLEAARLLGWTEIECTESSLEGLQAELAEIDENFVRSDLSTLEYGDLLLRRKEIYEALHPETKKGGDQKSWKIKTAKCRSGVGKPFSQDTAEKLGISRRTVERQIQTAKNLTPEAKAIIRSATAKVTKKDALKLSRMEPEAQEQAAHMLAAGEIHTVEEYPGELEPTPAQPDSSVPFAPEGKQFSSFRESVADLKDPNKDCSCTPDSFLAEITSFTRKFHREIQWYGTPYYEAVFPELTPPQLAYLRQQMDSVCEDANNLYHQAERKIHI